MRRIERMHVRLRSGVHPHCCRAPRRAKPLVAVEHDIRGAHGRWAEARELAQRMGSIYQDGDVSVMMFSYTSALFHVYIANHV